MKICGVTSQADALTCAAAGADAIGLNLSPTSSRHITSDVAAGIVAAMPSDTVTVGVFRDHDPEAVVKHMAECRFDIAQLHGDETVEQTRWIADRVPRVIKAFTAGSFDHQLLAAYETDPVLLDAAEPGSGQSHDWNATRLGPGGPRVLLAGGLAPANVQTAIHAAKPWGVDVASGVESAPGIKDPALVARFVHLAKTDLEP